MKELKPNNIIETIHFSLSTQECLDSSKSDTKSFTNGKLIHGTSLICLFNDTSLEIVDTESGKRKAAWMFKTTDSIEKISDICLCGDYLIIGLICVNGTGKLCLFHNGTSKVVKYIDIKHAPTSISIIKEFGGAGSGQFLSSFLKFFFGIVAVGTMDGHILLVDLNLDNFLKAFSVLSTGLHILDMSSGCDVFQSRKEAIDQGLHCAIDLSYNICNESTFKYVDHNGRLMRILPKGTSYVSCLCFLKNISSLLVGFNFGCFQIWSLETLQLIHSSEVGMLTSPVTHFIFQEPDDDPRHCCYIWVARGPEDADADISSQPASLTLHQLSYEVKTFRHNFGNIYKGFECIMKRFHHRLTSDVHHLVDSRSAGSRIISFKALQPKEQACSPQNEDEDDTKTDSSDHSICYVLWECVSTDGAVSCYLGLFDINRWYQKQLPGTIRDAMYGSMDAVCPFFAFYSLTDIVEHFMPYALLDAKINEKTISAFRLTNGPQNDQFYWPSSTTFLLSCFFESGKVTSEMLGVQRQIVAEMRKIGTDSFMDANNIIRTCWMTGLLQNSFDITRATSNKKHADAVLSINFENGGISFIIDCIKKWVHGSITHSGHSIKLIFDWAWAQIVQRKKTLDQINISLFSSLSNDLDTEQHNQLRLFAQDMKHLFVILNEVNNSDISTDQSGIKEIKARLHIAGHMAKYGYLLLYLVDMHLLPECSKVNKFNDELMSYPPDVMLNFYATQRSDRKQRGHCNLLIDSLMGDTLAVSNDVLSSYYPPSSIQEMCDIYFENPSDEKFHMLLLFYWILDLKECFDACREKNIVDNFQRLFDLSPANLVFIKSIWLIDHSQTKECVELITSSKSIFPAKYFVLIIKTLYKNEEYKLVAALSSFNILSKFSLCDWRFVLQVYIKMNLLYNAYQLLLAFTDDFAERKEILNFFLGECKKENLMGTVITLPFSSEDEGVLREYLQSTSAHGEFYLAYLLSRGLVTDAADLVKHLESVSAIRIDDKVQDQKHLRRLLVDGFIKSLPDIHHKVMNIADNKQVSSNVKSPLSSHLSLYPEQLMLGACFLSESKKEELCTKGIHGNVFVNPRRRKAPLFNSDVKMSPTKKAKVMLTPSTPTKTKHSPTKPRQNIHSMSDAYSLLKTPKLVKPRIQSFAIEVSTKTPQSILKSRASSRKKSLAFSVPSKFISKKPLHEDTPSRKIRFVGLSPTSPLSPGVTKSPIAEIIMELQSADYVTTERLTTGEILNDLSVDESPTENNFTDREDSFDNDTSFDDVKIRKSIDFHANLSPELKNTKSRNDETKSTSSESEELQDTETFNLTRNVHDETNTQKIIQEKAFKSQSLEAKAVEIDEDIEEDNVTSSNKIHYEDVVLEKVESDDSECIETSSSEYYDEDDEEIASNHKSDVTEALSDDSDVIEINESSDENNETDNESTVSSEQNINDGNNVYKNKEMEIKADEKGNTVQHFENEVNENNLNEEAHIASYNIIAIESNTSDKLTETLTAEDELGEEEEIRNDENSKDSKAAENVEIDIYDFSEDNDENIVCEDESFVSAKDKTNQTDENQTVDDAEVSIDKYAEVYDFQLDDDDTEHADTSFNKNGVSEHLLDSSSNKVSKPDLHDDNGKENSDSNEYCLDHNNEIFEEVSNDVLHADTNVNKHSGDTSQDKEKDVDSNDFIEEKLEGDRSLSINEAAINRNTTTTLSDNTDQYSDTSPNRSDIESVTDNRTESTSDEMQANESNGDEVQANEENQEVARNVEQLNKDGIDNHVDPSQVVDQVSSNMEIEKNNLHFQTKVVLETIEFSNQTSQRHSPQNPVQVEPKVSEKVTTTCDVSENITDDAMNSELDDTITLRRSRRISKKFGASKMIVLKDNIDAVRKELNAANKDLISIYAADSHFEQNIASENPPVENVIKTPDSKRNSRRSSKQNLPHKLKDSPLEVEISKTIEKPKVSTPGKPEVLTPDKLEISKQVVNKMPDSPSRNTRSKKRASIGPNPPLISRDEKIVELDMSRNEMMEPLIDESKQVDNIGDECLTKLSSRHKTISETSSSENLLHIATRSKSKTSESLENKIEKNEKASRRKTVSGTKDISQDFTFPPNIQRKSDVSVLLNKDTAVNESVLTFVDTEEKPKRKSRRSASTRASISIATLSPSRRSSRLKEKKEGI